jgi:hypothetical protein
MNGSGTDSIFEQQTQNSIKDGNSMKELDDNGPRKNRLLQNENHVLKINVVGSLNIAYQKTTT